MPRGLRSSIAISTNGTIPSAATAHDAPCGPPAEGLPQPACHWHPEDRGDGQPRENRRQRPRTLIGRHQRPPRQPTLSVRSAPRPAPCRPGWRPRSSSPEQPRKRKQDSAISVTPPGDQLAPGKPAQHRLRQRGRHRVNDRKDRHQAGDRRRPARPGAAPISATSPITPSDVAPTKKYAIARTIRAPRTRKGRPRCFVCHGELRPGNRVAARLAPWPHA